MSLEDILYDLDRAARKRDWSYHVYTNHLHTYAWDAFAMVTPPRPDLRDPPNRLWLGLTGLPPMPEYYPDRLEKHSR